MARERGAERIPCRIVTIDRLVEGNSVPAPTVMKMDIEGGEYAALCGARATIMKYRPHVIFESDENMVRYGYQRREILDLLASLGCYAFYYIAADGTLIPLTESNMGADYSDILARALPRAGSGQAAGA